MLEDALADNSFSMLEGYLAIDSTTAQTSFYYLLGITHALPKKAVLFTCYLLGITVSLESQIGIPQTNNNKQTANNNNSSKQ